MKITQQKLQQLIRESIFKRIRMFGKKEETKADIPDEIASDFGDGEEKDIVDDFEIEDENDESLTPMEISRRQALQYAAALAAGGLALSNLDLGSPGNSNVLPKEEFRALARSMLGEFYDLFELDFENNVAFYADPEFEIRLEPRDEYHGADDMDEIDWMIISYGNIYADDHKSQYLHNARFFDSYQNAEDYIRETLISLDYEINNAKDENTLRQNARKELGLGQYEKEFVFSREYDGCLIMNYGSKVRHVYRHRARFEMQTQIKQNGMWETVEHIPHRMTAMGQSAMEEAINNTLDVYQEYNLKE
mgnify:CR=1 FL=1